MSVGMHLMAYGGRDDKLFHRAVMQSGSPINYYTFDHNQTAFNTVAHGTGCGSSKDPIQCLREVPFDTLNNFLNSTDLLLHWRLVIDNDIIKEKTSLQLAKGEFVHVPIIIGANSDEGTAWGPSPVNSEEDFVHYLEGEMYRKWLSEAPLLIPSQHPGGLRPYQHHLPAMCSKHILQLSLTVLYRLRCP